MKNTILNFKKETVEIELGFERSEYEVRDYFSKKINVSDIVPEILDMMAIYEMYDGDTIERVSFELYGTTDYWDILIMLNERSPLYDMPYEDGTIQEQSETFIFQYQNFVYSHAPLIQRRATILLNELIESRTNDNESLRALYIIKPSEMNRFLSLIKEYEYI
jgi:hypothetical protein